MSGNSAIQGSMTKNAAKYALSPLTQASQRYGWPRGLSTAAGATDLKPRRGCGAPVRGAPHRTVTLGTPVLFMRGPWLPKSLPECAAMDREFGKHDACLSRISSF